MTIAERWEMAKDGWSRVCFRLKVFLAYGLGHRFQEKSYWATQGRNDVLVVEIGPRSSGKVEIGETEVVAEIERRLTRFFPHNRHEIYGHRTWTVSGPGYVRVCPCLRILDVIRVLASAGSPVTIRQG